jgi:hypothetical protein
MRTEYVEAHFQLAPVLQIRCLFPNPLPRVLHVPRFRAGLAHTQPQRHLPVQLRMREKQIAAPVQTVHDRLIRRIPSFVPKAH